MNKWCALWVGLAFSTAACGGRRYVLEDSPSATPRAYATTGATGGAVHEPALPGQATAPAAVAVSPSPTVHQAAAEGPRLEHRTFPDGSRAVRLAVGDDTPWLVLEARDSWPKLVWVAFATRESFAYCVTTDASGRNPGRNFRVGVPWSATPGAAAHYRGGMMGVVRVADIVMSGAQLDCAGQSSGRGGVGRRRLPPASYGELQQFLRAAAALQREPEVTALVERRLAGDNTEPTDPSVLGIVGASRPIRVARGEAGISVTRDDPMNIGSVALVGYQDRNREGRTACDFDTSLPERSRRAGVSQTFGESDNSSIRLGWSLSENIGRMCRQRQRPTIVLHSGCANGEPRIALDAQSWPALCELLEYRERLRAIPFLASDWAPAEGIWQAPDSTTP
jgi:hypothetical protein